MASTQPAHDPALQYVSSAPAANQPASGNQPAAPGATQPSLPGNVLAGMAPEQLAAILKHIPDLLNRVRLLIIPDRPASRPAPRFASSPSVARGCVEHALHVIEGIGHVRRRDRGGRAGRVGGVHPAVTWGVLCLIALHDAL